MMPTPLSLPSVLGIRFTEYPGGVTAARLAYPLFSTQPSFSYTKQIKIFHKDIVTDHYASLSLYIDLAF